ncbi:Maf family protein [Rhodobaculum claviforme]|uniref:Nucleoside triphosphate pyrophosphatase n=1 Tax=Rhodobaculum claviforme TaxID=1549854 RepID=A0A934TJ10_9RHOB|nr:Maf family protein [Rhodobaculum claviforme]MBK5927035.1 septum formation protein Maf [Rhodobaculum claviforme]
MSEPLILASGSAIRAQLLRRAGLSPEVVPARIDEGALQAALVAEGAAPRDVADALAEQKARKVSQRRPGALVLGCDQVMVFEGAVLGKPGDIAEARTRLRALRGQSHQLISAAVLYRDGVPVWRHLDHATLLMREFSDAFLEAYLERGWPELAQTVGAYKVEEDGVRLFADIQGSHFTVLGLPLIPLLVHLGRIGVIEA